MNDQPKRTPESGKHFGLPTKLAYSVFRVAVAGSLACSASTSGNAPPSVDASADTSIQDSSVADASKDAAGEDVAIRDSATDAVPTIDGSPIDAMDDCNEADAPFYCGSSGAIDGAVCPGPTWSPTSPPGCEPFV
jgi:hypothetical protein